MTCPDEAAAPAAAGARGWARDAALVLSLPPGLYTMQVQAAPGGSGVALAEIYEVR